ncbi:MAG: arginyltransferase [Planctomycetes bacterium]|nr:arginyltransferase [Planctomycetota bacterium]
MRDDHDPFLDWLDQQELPRSPLYDCPYLPGRQARQVGFATPQLPGALYERLLDRGFRRTGEVFFTMDCPDCRACVPLRVPTASFRPSRSQRRACSRNRDVRVEFRAPACSDESYQLYRRYLQHQHPGTPQDESEQHFRETLYGAVVDSLEARYLVGDRLIGVSLLDVCSDSWSSVYHFFDPDERRRSVGVFSVVAEIDEARRRGVPFYHLGYWIEGAATMQYKANYRPHELLRGGVWKRDR